ncbi:MAG: cation:proton antiporter [Acidobacteriota bacterium]|nr:cation:proton antiporter [Acidobacteriota bacterium]
METLFSSIDYKDPIWIAVAFVFGLLVRLIGLPPLVGFLVAGFTLNALGVENSLFLNEMADLGVTLLMFIIGLKLRIKELARAEVWCVTLVHMILLSLFFALWLLLFQKAGFPLFDNLNLKSAAVMGFAMSFSSTVFVMKVLETRGDLIAGYGRMAIGVLIVQDIAAVVFLGFSTGKLPSVWAAILILILMLGRRVLYKLLNYIDHGELLVLFGLTLALGGAALFEAVDLKGDLGALIFGVLLSTHAKTGDLARDLFSMKELFLIGFFLSIGMAGLPTFATVAAAAVLLLAILLKSCAFFFLFSRFRVRSRTAVAASIALGNYSEFGLIVASVSVSAGWLPESWLITMAVLVASSFVVSSVFNNRADDIFSRFNARLIRFQHDKRLAGDENIDLTGYQILVCGMGRVGGGAYDRFAEQGRYKVLGLDFDEVVVQRRNQAGQKTIFANFSSPDFWNRLNPDQFDVKWIVLCSPNPNTSRVTAGLARNWGFKGFISASSKYPEDEETLREEGVDAVFNIYAEAGAGLAQHGLTLFYRKSKDIEPPETQEGPAEPDPSAVS